MFTYKNFTVLCLIAAFLITLGSCSQKAKSNEEGSAEAKEERAPAKKTKKVLMLDYSLDNIETPLMKKYIPEGVEVVDIHVTSGDQMTLDLLDQGITHVIHSGSELMVPNVSEAARANAKALIRKAKEMGLPQYGICFGHQLITATLAGVENVGDMPTGREIGWEEITFTEAGQALFGVNETEIQFQLHTQEVTVVPEGAVQIATNDHCPIQGWVHKDYKIMTTQFHPEMDKEYGDMVFTEYEEALNSVNKNLADVLKLEPTVSAQVFFDVWLSWE